MATTKTLIPVEDLLKGRTDEELRAWIEAYLAEQPNGGCNACRFADPFSEEICTLPDISAADFDTGIHGVNCSRFQPLELKKDGTPTQQ